MAVLVLATGMDGFKYLIWKVGAIEEFEGFKLIVKIDNITMDMQSL